MKYLRTIIQLLSFAFVAHGSAQTTILDSSSKSASFDSTQYLAAIDSIEFVDSQNLVIVFAGDIMGHDTQIQGAYVDSTKSYNYEPTFRHIKDYISSADIAVANLEVTLAGPPFKGYPQFSSPDNLALEAQAAGFDIFITANNHALDRGEKGVDRTISMLDSFNIVHAGTYKSPEERELRYPLIVEKKNVRIALLNYTYGTNGLKVNLPYIVNRIDTAQIRIDLAKAELAKPDFIICTLHWGQEYERTENAAQRALTRFLFDNGVDAIIGSHPHVVQPIRIEYSVLNDSSKSCPVVYSLGNFVSNQRAQYKDGGIIAELHLSKAKAMVRFDSIRYLPYWVYREKIAEDKYAFYTLPVAKYENDTSIVDFNDTDLFRFNRFKNDTRNHMIDSKESVYYDRTNLLFLKEED